MWSLFCENAPKYSQKSETDAVLRILTADVREISHITDQENTQYALNVIADPLEYNLAHALIVRFSRVPL